jgi:hypothetical protein
MISIMGALFAAILAVAPLREFFDLELLTAGQWFICMASVAAGLVAASALWRLPYIQALEVDPEHEPTGAVAHPMPPPTHGRFGAGDREEEAGA